MTHIWNISYRKIGGLRFLKIGRLTFSWSLAQVYRPFKPRNISEACANVLGAIDDIRQLNRRQG